MNQVPDLMDYLKGTGAYAPKRTEPIIPSPSSPTPTPVSTIQVSSPTPSTEFSPKPDIGSRSPGTGSSLGSGGGGGSMGMLGGASLAELAQERARARAASMAAGGSVSTQPTVISGKDEMKKKETKALPAPTTKPKPTQSAEAADWMELTTPEGYKYYHNKVSNVTTWDKPDCLKSPDEMDRAGEWVWMPHEDWGYVPAKKLPGTFGDGKVHLEDEEGQRHTVTAKAQLDELKWSSLRRIVADLVMLDDMSLPLILHNLKTRFQNNDIYTNVGSILISINPYKMLPLYTPTIIDNYHNRGTKTMPPHIYLIADEAYKNLLDSKKSQSIVISGESGAGKTECTKQALQFLAEVAGSATSNVEQRILASNPILEAFGNAKTVRNNNSSRFGKYVEIYFNSRYQICGASNTNYLLEKIRVITQSVNERNYHSFYQLVRGASDEMRQRLGLTKKHAGDYYYLSQSGCVDVDGVDDAKEYDAVLSAMTELGWTKEDIDQVYTTLAGVLHLGDVKFTTEGDRKCAIENGPALEKVVNLLQLPPTFTKAMTTRVMRITGQPDIDVPLSKEEAAAARDATAKFIYEKMFDWIVQRINIAIGRGDAIMNGSNNSTSSSSSSSSGVKIPSISILDIFGFEVFELNLFEQLCINFTNEKLQQFFNQHTFKKEEELYQAEAIKFVHVQYIDNQPVLDLIEKKPHGILPSVDEEIRMPKGSDKALLQKLVNNHGRSQHFRSYIRNPNMFVVEHYAGVVVYDPTGFLEKNRDQLNEDAVGVLQQSQFQFLQSLFTDPTSSTSSSSGLGARKATLGSKFAKQLDDLMTALNQTEPHYVRCVKPNPNKSALEFHPMLVLEQLRYSGVFEAVKIRKSGYPFRYSHKEFVKRYKCVYTHGQTTRTPAGRIKLEIRKLPSWGSDIEAALALVKHMEMREDEVQIGKTRVLYRAEQHRTMELKRNLAVEQTVIQIQKNIKRCVARRLKKRLLAARPIFQEAIRQRTVEAIDSAFHKTGHLGFDLYEATQAKRLKYVIEEEKRIDDLLNRLMKQDPESVFEDLNKAVAAADEIKYESPAAVEARKVIEGIKDRKKARLWLVQGIEEADEEKLAWAVEAAERLSLSGVDSQVKAAKEMIQRIKDEGALSQTMDNALATGGYIADGCTLETQTLSAAVGKAQLFGMKTSRGKETLTRASAILSVRVTLSQALGTKDKEAWRAVGDAVQSASGVPGLQNHSEVVKAAEEVSHQAAVEDVAAKIEVAVSQFNQEALTFLLDQAQRLRVDETKYTIVPVARDLLARIIQARELMHTAMSVVDQGKLVYAVQNAESFNYETEETIRCRQLRDLVLQINLEAEYILTILEEEPMRDILNRAETIKLDTPNIQELRRLLFHTSEEKLVQLQLKAAVALSDLGRRVRLTLKLKDLFFKKQGAMFAIDKFPRYRDPSDWADLKLLTLNREKLAGGMRKHTTDPIHAALTETHEDSKKETVAKRMFKNILGFMGDRSYSSPITLCQELLQNALLDKWVGDELYLQLVKQLTGNPSRESESKGWQLLAIFLETFPPQPELENYLEMWLRNTPAAAIHGGGTGNNNRYVRLLHTVVFCGARPQPPNEQEIHKVTMGGALRTLDFDAKYDYIPPQAAIPPPGRAAEYALSLSSPVAVTSPEGDRTSLSSSTASSTGSHTTSPSTVYASTPATTTPPSTYVSLSGGYPSRPTPPTNRPSRSTSNAEESKGPFKPTPPSRPQPKVAPPPPAPPAQPQWGVAYSNGTPYYYHLVTGETTWVKPEGFVG